MNSLENYLPKRIICLTEESVETLFLIGKGELIQGVSAFVKRPKEALSLPKVSFFTSSNYNKILDTNPDLILGYSDIQKDIARDLIELGQNVFISNHRSLNETLNYIYTLSSMVGAPAEGQLLVKKLQDKISSIQEMAAHLSHRPKVYFEEWDEPMISAIEWVSECIGMSGGENIFNDRSHGILAKDRYANLDEVESSNPDIILCCWCGKKFNEQNFLKRFEGREISAINNKQYFELAPEIFLQPGPAPILEGLDQLYQIFKKWSDNQK